MPLDYDLSNYVISSTDDITTILNIGSFNIDYYCLYDDNFNVFFEENEITLLI